MQAIVTVVAIGLALWIILSNQFPEDSKKWAYGIIGTVIGFWLKG